MIIQQTRCFFRADGNSQIGWGHVVRMLALATIVKQEFSCVFAIQEPSPQLSRQITEAGLNILALPASNFIEEAHTILNTYIHPKDIIVLDGYNFSTEYQRILKEKNNRLVCIDDLSTFHFLADAIINPAGNVKQEKYSKEPYTKLYTGPKYALLRTPFLEMAKNRNRSCHSNFQRLFINMGGADPENYTSKVLQQIQKDNYQEIHIVVGGSYKHKASLQEIIAEAKSVFVHTNLSAEEMSALMRECGTAICSASTVSYEYCCAGGLLFIVKTADNQSSLYKFLLNEGLALSFENEFTKEQTDLLAKKENLLKKQAYYFDGSSATNLLTIFQHVALYNQLLIRKATVSDMQLLFDWANDPEVRRFAYNPQPIRWEVHQTWFHQKIQSDTSFLYIFYLPGAGTEIPVAQIRFDIKEGQAIISYLIDQNFRGKGLGHIILLKGVEIFLQENAAASAIIGFVQHANVASCKSFEKANFSLIPVSEPLPYPDSRKYIFKIK
ncbi:UDP-2,4-diacetamido-2,4,6-trideoxy-beta-L-altropyranose hydrolase [Rhodocytophaga aerolata]|uniref:UDP-2,4-diacetamido-2,4, 6-trideoxy-beta-L-altropyranose hydrolase n=1 Tax=Rhodocytophaga aerolata TaxID=455078 RepID=A0ABT8QZ69_9BACT|nr:UDP-2,4-diacetamido-2,4,6-trideoxy-beta-L-altropyranose hydrolase [Rhodocytophaga aerolata]MDO1445139.1 UDP-2,4-diacetamido-2,4,6-trideoxy-beta-L-altropyranose hydrolase [Rhodocytophaga aerolata]